MTVTACALSIPARVVVFDYGEVISRLPSEASRAVFRTTDGAGPDALSCVLRRPSGWARSWQHQHPPVLAVDRRHTGANWSEARIHELWVADSTRRISIDPEVLEIVAELHAGGTRIALLSIAGFDFASPFRYSPIAQFFERMFVSAEMLKLKPEADIHQEVASEVGITCAEMVFIDNRLVNVDGAVALGITGHHFAEATGLRRFHHTLADR